VTGSDAADAVTTLGTPGVQDLASADGTHTGTETVRAGPMQVAGLVGALHDRVIQESWKKGAKA
jgi:hypothetical protein